MKAQAQRNKSSGPTSSTSNRRSEGQGMSRQRAVQEDQVQGRRRNDQAPETRRNHLSTRDSESRNRRRNPLFAEHKSELDEEQFFDQLPTL